MDKVLTPCISIGCNLSHWRGALQLRFWVQTNTPMEERQITRATVIELIMGTDMKQHFSLMSRLQARHWLSICHKLVQYGASGAAQACWACAAHIEAPQAEQMACTAVLRHKVQGTHVKQTSSHPADNQHVALPGCHPIRSIFRERGSVNAREPGRAAANGHHHARAPHDRPPGKKLFTAMLQQMPAACI